ncbi:MAG: beta-propeller domain-containing protein [Henriciella sp.]|nr:beta-propeller domain-containing protein [Henriciella sp.]
MLNRWLVLGASALSLTACATTDFSKPSDTAWPELSTFKSEAEFEHYYRTVTGQLERDESESDWAEIMPMSAPPPPPPPPAMAEVADGAFQESVVVVTAAAVADENPSITNTQEAGVDEGDIVKQIGQYLIVMQDGRLFSIDLLPDGESGLRHVDRENVYRTTEEDTWYDEMLVFGRQMIVIGYSYDAEASVFAVLELEDNGEITFRDRFFLPAQDYFDGDNYTTRLVNGQLALHTSFYLSDVDRFEQLNAPVLSRTMAPEDTPPLAARRVYRPVQDAADPLLHTITICPLRDLKDESSDVPDCNTTAFLAGDSYEYYASQDAVWLWVNKESGRWWMESDEDDTRESTGLLYRIPYDRSAAPGFARVAGEPVNQFSLAAGTDVFRAFVEVDEEGDTDHDASPYRILQLALSDIGRAPPNIDKADYISLPNVSDGSIENRFTNTHFVYTTHNTSWWYWEDESEAKLDAQLTFVPLESPDTTTQLKLPHGVIRLERARDHIVATGYGDSQGLNLTVFDLRAEAPRMGGSVKLLERYESENRSHAFNSQIDADGAGLIGLPTVKQQWEAGRWVWRSDSSDISYLRVGTDASLSSVGTLKGANGEPDASYECEVSCVDWYGNSRPIFTFGRTFALSGTSLVEGEVSDNGVQEIRRVDLTKPLAR